MRGSTADDGWLTASRRALPVLMYHSISDDPETGVAPYYKTATSRAVFEAQIRCLSDPASNLWTSPKVFAG